MKILVVDDEKEVRNYLEEAISDMSHEVVSVSDGYQAIDYIRENDVHLAYIDIDMPGINGFETLKRIREIDPKVSGVLILGDDVSGLLEGQIKKGVYVSLEKPFTIEQIEEINNAFEEIKGPLEFIYENPYGLDTEKLSKASILVTDDEKDILKVIVDCLEAEGFSNYNTSIDGEDAIKKFNEGKHDVALIDILMPKKSGMEVLQHIKAISPNSQAIIITGNADKDTAILALKLGAYDYIEKPFDLDSLLRIVKRAIEKKLLLDEIGLIT